MLSECNDQKPKTKKVTFSGGSQLGEYVILLCDDCDKKQIFADYRLKTEVLPNAKL